MISFETAKKLKEAGLQWEYNQNDCFYHILSTTTESIRNGNITGIITHSYKYPGNKFVYSGEWGFGFNLSDEAAEKEIERVVKYSIFAPRLDQLLAEIEKYSEFVKITKLVMGGNWLCVIDAREQFEAKTPDEAAGLALIWILKDDKLNHKIP